MHLLILLCREFENHPTVEHECPRCPQCPVHRQHRHLLEHAESQVPPQIHWVRTCATDELPL